MFWVSLFGTPLGRPPPLLPRPNLSFESRLCPDCFSVTLCLDSSTPLRCVKLDPGAVARNLFYSIRKKSPRSVRSRSNTALQPVQNEKTQLFVLQRIALLF